MENESVMSAIEALIKEDIFHWETENLKKRERVMLKIIKQLNFHSSASDELYKNLKVKSPAK